MTAAELIAAWRGRHDLSRAAFARRLGASIRTVEAWEAAPDQPGHRTPPLYLLRLALCELERRIAERNGLGFCSCRACGAIAVEDSGQDDRYGCILCGARTEP